MALGLFWSRGFNTGITLLHVAVGLGGVYALKALAGERVDVNRPNSREHAPPVLHKAGRSGEGRGYESAVC